MLDLKTVIVPIITPKLNSGVDRDSLKKLIEFLIESGIDSIFVLGTTGEFHHLTLQQKKEIIEDSISFANNKLQVLVGVSDNELVNTIELIKFSEEKNANAIVIAPMFGTEDPEKLLNSVMEVSSLPVILYNNPYVHNGKSIPLELVKKYSKHPKIAGIKDSSADWNYFQELLKLSSEKFNVLQGNEKLLIESLNNGAVGIICGCANANPRLFKSVFESRDISMKTDIENLHKEVMGNSPDPILGIKQKLVKLGIIKSAELF